MNCMCKFMIFFFRYIWSGLIVVFGIYLNVYSKNKESWDAYLLLKLGEIKTVLGYGKLYKKYSSTTTNI